MAAVRQIEEFLFSKAPKELAMDWDNVGLLVGFPDREVDKILVALDITGEVADEAAGLGAQLIVAHHPVMNCAWEKVQTVRSDTVQGSILIKLLTAGISGICMHTNLDAVAGGVNDALAQRLGLSHVEQLHPDGVDPQGRPYGIGRVGEAAGFADAKSFAAFVRDALRADGLRLEDAGRPVRRVAVGGGACGGMLSDAAAKGCDTFVTADVKYDVFLTARALGVNLIDAGHFSTENVVCPVLASWLGEGFPEAEVVLSQRHKEVFSCL